MLSSFFLSATSAEFWRNRPSRQLWKCPEDACRMIGPSKLPPECWSHCRHEMAQTNLPYFQYSREQIRHWEYMQFAKAMVKRYGECSFVAGNMQASEPEDPVVWDKTTTRYEYWEVLSPPSVCFDRESPYVFVPHTSIGGQFLGFEMYRCRGKRKIRRKKAKQTRQWEKQIYSHPKGGCKFGCFYYKTGEQVTLLTKNCPPSGVCAVFVYCFSSRYLVELGLQKLGLTIPWQAENNGNSKTLRQQAPQQL